MWDGGLEEVLPQRMGAVGRFVGLAGMAEDGTLLVVAGMVLGRGEGNPHDG